MSDQAIERLHEELPYPAFNPAFVPIELDPNTVEIRVGPWAGPSYTIRDPEQEGRLADLIDQLDGETHVQQIFSQLTESEREDFATLVLKLTDGDVIYDGSGKPDDNWAHLTLRREFQHQQRDQLDEQNVLVVNCGRTGRQVASDLVDIGIGEVGVVEPIGGVTDDREYRDDVVEFDSGMLDESIASADFVVFGADRPFPDVVERINKLALDHATPWSVVQIHGFDGFVGPTVVPEETACYRCFRERSMAAVDDADGYRAYLEYMEDDPTATQLRLPGMSRMLAGYLVMDLVNLLTFGSGFTKGRVFAVDGLRLSIECNDVLKLPRCHACGKTPGDDHSRFVDLNDVVSATQRFETRGDK